LSNDGFIYPSRDTLSVDEAYDSSTPQNQRTGWVQLSDETVGENFPAILAGGKTFLGLGEEESISVQVLYHEREERVDFKLQKEDGSSRVLVTFEPGYPEHFHDDDNWGVF
ncbi:MAG: hypothetical protein SGILL_008795, partial [Bacillariaceae sp.]